MADTNEPDDGFIAIVNEKINGTARVPEDAYELVWKDKGWRKASDNKVEQIEQKAERAAARKEA